jgi:hypothetical protein
VALAGVAVYVLLAVPPLLWLGSLGPGPAVLLAGIAAILGVAVEGPSSLIPVDDDLAMTIVPGVALTVALLAGHGLGISLS